MSSKAESDVMEVLDTAMGAFGEAMKAGVKAQEQMSKWWSEAIACGNPLGDWQKRSQQMFDEAVPAAQRHAQEYIKLLEQNYRRSVDLLKKALDSNHNGSADGLGAKMRELWDESICVVKDNTQSMAQANVRLLETWTDLMKKNFEQGEAAFKSAAATAAKVAK